MSLTTETRPLQMLRAAVSVPDLYRWMDVRSFHDPDHAMHCLLSECFGHSRTPQPFRLRLRLPRNNHKGVLEAYCRRTVPELLEDLAAYAGPRQERILPADRIEAKAMPENWRVGRTLGFEARLCPTIRRTGNPSDSGKPNAEYDAYRRALEKLMAGEAAPDREQVYCRWLERRLERQGGARLDWARLASFMELECERKNRTKPLRMPSAVLQGQLTVADSARFNDLLAQGIGRHKAYGYGMLLLKPADNAC